MTFTSWPVALRSQLVHAYRPGERTASEGPFRTLRKHAWATPGVRITPRLGGRLEGQLTIFSSLNLISARLARRGMKEAAVRVAAAATKLESGPKFRRFSEILAALPASDAKRVIDGVIPEDAPAELLQSLKAVAGETKKIRDRVSDNNEPAEVLVGRVKEVHESYVLLVLMSGPETLIPHWMARAIGRATVGALLALVTDKLDGASAVVEALPAIDVNDDIHLPAFSPFGRGDHRALSVTADDARLLTGEPEPLQILIPVTVQ